MKFVPEMLQGLLQGFMKVYIKLQRM